MKILVIAAHPDDEILGMGGTIKKYTKNGNDVKIIIMATGITSRRSTNFKSSTKYNIDEKIDNGMDLQVKKIRNHGKKAAKLVGVDDIEFFDFPDNEMDLVSNLEITKKIEDVIKKFNPDKVYTHSLHDVNVDHRILYNATLTATRPIVGCKVKEVITFEIPSSTEWYFPASFSPNIFVNIEKELSYKIKALKAYTTEIHDFPHPRSAKALEISAGRWGSVSGFKAAEAFSLVRSLNQNV